MNHKRGITTGEGIMTLVGVAAGCYLEHRRQSEEIKRGERNQIDPLQVVGGGAVGGVITYGFTRLSPGQLASSAMLFTTAVKLANSKSGENAVQNIIQAFINHKPTNGFNNGNLLG